jgi:hypothetical protein
MAKKVKNMKIVINAVEKSNKFHKMRYRIIVGIKPIKK